ncbi:DUF397 domain-containing protein [Streptomyces millisiae]|uniref:DUF397 domain-containing protein n=1 Tax=Streptomyces millisiae TaxID=3075542 RepID=A0ABU2LSN4_9ACTN|nr:DUF397 domain-containing protein [Streptomyces sp. DSM 44918]MDT0320068.1 DUF397 domain-containing protein [Streptomyces sp. DSM 44918]
MRSPGVDLSAAVWRRSSYSNQDGGECLEVADGIPGVLPIRDSKRPDGPVLVVDGAAWAGFVAAVRGCDARAFPS